MDVPGKAAAMARFARLEVLVTILRQGFVPLFHHADAATATRVVDAVAAGGADVVEFTHRGDRAHEVFAALDDERRARLPDTVLGVGSVTDAGTAALYLALGADFVVSPTLSEEVARVCNRRKVAYLPGCATPTEIARAEELGCEIVKLFPGDAAGGPDLVRAVRGPAPWTRLMPTGGVAPTEASLSAWFDAGAACVGLGAGLVAADLVRDGRFDELTARVRETADLVASVRPPLDEAWA